jgi:hypothetical protein
MNGLRRSGRLAAAGLVVAVALGGVPARRAGAQAPGSDEQVTVMIGVVRCFVIRRPEGAMTAAERAERIHYVFAKHLGSGRGEFTLEKGSGNPAGRVRVFMNGDPLINVTTNDARATGYQQAEELAPIWKRSLERAFEQTTARGDSPPAGG